jgi:hypothetical protein
MQPLLRFVDSCAPQNFRPRDIPDRDRKTSSLQFSRFSSSLREKRNFSQRVSLELLDALHGLLTVQVVARQFELRRSVGVVGYPLKNRSKFPRRPAFRYRNLGIQRPSFALSLAHAGLTPCGRLSDRGSRLQIVFGKPSQSDRGEKNGQIGTRKLRSLPARQVESEALPCSDSRAKVHRWLSPI